MGCWAYAVGAPLKYYTFMLDAESTRTGSLTQLAIFCRSSANMELLSGAQQLFHFFVHRMEFNVVLPRELRGKGNL